MWPLTPPPQPTDPYRSLCQSSTHLLRLQPCCSDQLSSICGARPSSFQPPSNAGLPPTVVCGVCLLAKKLVQRPAWCGMSYRELDIVCVCTRACAGVHVCASIHACQCGFMLCVCVHSCLGTCMHTRVHAYMPMHVCGHGSLEVGRRHSGKLSGKESACQCRRHEFSPWVGKIPWRKKWLPTPVFLPGESHGQRSLEDYSPWDCKRVKHNFSD